jgi:hypothetical protein
MIAADVVTPQDVGNLLTLVAPGFFTYAAYAYRYPRRALSDLPMLVTSVALSLPVVALARSIAPRLHIGTSSGTHLAYAVLLVALGLAAGTLAGWLRAWGVTQRALEALGFFNDPAPDVASKVFSTFRGGAGLVTVTLKDGPKLAGAPLWYTTDPEADRREVFLVKPRVWDDENQSWGDRDPDGGALVALDDVVLLQTAYAAGKAPNAL